MKIVKLFLIVFLFSIAIIGCNPTPKKVETPEIITQTGTAPAPTVIPATVTPTEATTAPANLRPGIDTPVVSGDIDIQITSIVAFKQYTVPETGVTFNAPEDHTGFAVTFKTSADDQAFNAWLDSKCEDLFVTFSNGETKCEFKPSLMGSSRTILLGGKNITITSITVPDNIVIDLTSFPQTVPVP